MRVGLMLCFGAWIIPARAIVGCFDVTDVTASEGHAAVMQPAVNGLVCDLATLPVQWSVSGPDAAHVVVDPETGTLTWSAMDYENPTDANGDQRHEVVLSATYVSFSLGLGGIRILGAQVTESEAIALTITDVNEFRVSAPHDIDLQANTVGEDAVYGDSLGLTVSAEDTDGSQNEVSYHLITDTSSGGFAVDLTTGVTSVLDASRLTVGEHTLQIEARSVDGSTADALFSVTVISSDTQPPQMTSSEAFTRVEGDVPVADVTFDEVASTVLEGSDAALFSLASSGQLSFLSAPVHANPQDLNQDNVYVLSVRASDAWGNTGIYSVQVTVTADPRLQPTPTPNPGDTTAPRITGPTAISMTSGDTLHGIQFVADEAVTWSLGGPDGSVFVIAPSGELHSQEPLLSSQPRDHDQNNLYLLSVIATDAMQNQTQISVFVTVDRPSPLTNSVLLDTMQHSIDDISEAAFRSITTVTERLLALQQTSDTCQGMPNQGVALKFQNPEVAQFVAHAGLDRWLSQDVCDLFQDHSALWTAGTLLIGRRDGQAGRDGLDLSLQQLSLGYDWRASDAQTLGMALTFGDQSLTEGDHVSDVSSQSIHLKAYGQHQLSEHMFLRGLVGLGVFTVAHQRQIAGNTYRGKRAAEQWLAQTGIDYRLPEAIGPVSLRLTADADLAMTDLAGYTETGGVDALAYAAQRAWAGAFRVAGQFERDVLLSDARIRSRLALGVQSRYQDAEAAAVCYADQPEHVIFTSYPRRSSDVVDLALGVSVWQRNLVWDLAYRWMQDSEQTNYQSVTGKLRYPFGVGDSGALALRLTGVPTDASGESALAAHLQFEQRF